MWYKTKATELLGIDYPILQGPFGGGLSSVELVSTVSNAGGLGGYGAYTLTPAEIVDLNNQIRAATDKPYNINLWVSDTDAVNGTVTDEQYARAAQLFKPYFDEVGIPLPEKTAIRLQLPEPVAMERIRVPVRSTPVLPLRVPIILYTSPWLSVTVKGVPATFPPVVAPEGVISTMVLLSVATTQAHELALPSLELWVKLRE